MEKNILAVVLILAVLGAGFLIWQQKEKPEPLPEVKSFEECLAAGYAILESYPRQCRTSEGKLFTEDIGNELKKANLIKIETPRPNKTIQSPVVIRGEARGYWYFEAAFPVKLVDEAGNVLAQHYAQAQGEWMTEDFVPFSAELTFEVSKAQKATLILEKDNPSGLPENADELRMPVLLNPQPSAERAVQLYYYSGELDKDETGNVLCSRQGLIVVERKIPITQTPIQDTIRLLISGDLTAEERAEGISTEYPLEGFSLKGAALNNGVLTLEFSDPDNRSGGGSCRVGILWFQIEATAKQFPEVEEVRFLPEELFQP